MAVPWRRISPRRAREIADEYIASLEGVSMDDLRRRFEPPSGSRVYLDVQVVRDARTRSECMRTVTAIVMRSGDLWVQAQVMPTFEDAPTRSGRLGKALRTAAVPWIVYGRSARTFPLDGSEHASAANPRR